MSMKRNVNVLRENESRYPKFTDFGELLYCSYANLQMLSVALDKKNEI